MPQVDLETLVSVCAAAAGDDRKIACETLADGSQPPQIPDLPPDVPPDFPPESFWLSKDAEFDWFDRNAIFERKDSTKLVRSNSNSNSTNFNLNSNSSSQRFSKSLKSKASVIGLPKTQKNSYIDPNRRYCKPVNIRMFPKRSESTGTEPSSPKVSCMGRVRSKRARRRSSEPATAKTNGPKKGEKTRTTTSHRRSGFFRGLISMFRPNRCEKPTVEPESQVELPPRNSVAMMKVHQIPVSVEPVAEPVGLGGMMRFSSGRRSESWSADELDVDGVRSELSNRDYCVEKADGGPTRRS